MRRAGRDYPAALDGQHASSIADVLVVHDADAAVDPELRGAGAASAWLRWEMPFGFARRSHLASYNAAR